MIVVNREIFKRPILLALVIVLFLSCRDKQPSIITINKFQGIFYKDTTSHVVYKLSSLTEESSVTLFYSYDSSGLLIDSIELGVDPYFDINVDEDTIILHSDNSRKNNKLLAFSPKPILILYKKNKLTSGTRSDIVVNDYYCSNGNFVIMKVTADSMVFNISNLRPDFDKISVRSIYDDSVTVKYTNLEFVSDSLRNDFMKSVFEFYFPRINSR